MTCEGLRKVIYMHLPKLRVFVLIVVTLLLLAVTACSDTAATDLTLDPDTLQATGSEGTYQARAVAGAHVGEVTDDLFIAVAVEDGAEAAEAREGQPVSVYLCDGEFSQWLRGELDAQGQTVLEEELGAKVRLGLAGDGEIAGIVQVPGARPQPFTATAATGEAGLYRAQQTFAGVEASAGWVVLNDGRQRGSACCECWPPPGYCAPECCPWNK